MNVAACPVYPLFLEASDAAGPDALLVKECLADVEESIASSYYLAGNVQIAKAELAKLATKATNDNWDGEGGSKISPESLDLAFKLIRSMPRDWLAPDFDLDSDGNVSLDWYGGPSRRLSVGVGKNGKLSYAWMLPNKRGKVEQNYGVAQSEGLFPETVIEVLPKLVQNGG
ncbi:MAG: hypothetical protein ABSA05_00760 [Opitutaceae bacterium]|jgi:hypothetical protein